MTTHVRHAADVWLLARASGVTAYLLVFGAVVTGLASKAKIFGRQVRGALLTDTHQLLSLLGIGFLALHGVTLYMDKTVNVSLSGLLIPGATSFRPFWVGVGVISAWLWVIVELSSRLRAKIGVGLWRRLHFLTFAVFLLGAAHGIYSGTDSSEPWAVWMYDSTIGIVVALLVWRILSLKPRL